MIYYLYFKSYSLSHEATGVRGKEGRRVGRGREEVIERERGGGGREAEREGKERGKFKIHGVFLHFN